jgi:predicted transcriptional regulator
MSDKEFLSWPFLDETTDNSPENWRPALHLAGCHYDHSGMWMPSGQLWLQLSRISGVTLSLLHLRQHRNIRMVPCITQGDPGDTRPQKILS